MSFSLQLRAALILLVLACAAPCSAASPTAASPRPDGLKDAEWRSLEGAIAKATEEAKLAVGSASGADGAQGDNFGNSVAVSGDTALVGVYFDDVGASDEQGSAYVFVRSGTSWSLQAKLVAADAGEYQYFGQSVALEGDTALIGTDGTPGAAYVFTRSGTSWSQQAKLAPSDSVATDRFGASVALSADTAIVGAPFDDVGTNTRQGSAYVFTRTGASWSEQAKLVAGNGFAGDRFGGAVAISGDSVVVGAAYATTSSAGGTAYVFVRSGATWSQQAELDRASSASEDFFGFSVAISGDTAAVGVLFDNVGATADQGTVRVYVRSGATWTEQATLVASDGSRFAQFGRALALVGDTVVVGAVSADAAYVFTRNGMTWSQQAKIAGGGCSGAAVALSGDTALVGDECGDVGGNLDQGVARVHVRSGTIWSLEAQIDQGNGGGEQELGVTVALSGDTALVGAPYDSAAAFQQGAAFVFVRSGAAWMLQARLLASDALARDAFGAAVALSGDTALIGANGADIDAIVDQGSAYVFVRSGITWTQQSKLVAADGTASAAFGGAVALDGNTALVGAAGATVGATSGQGAAYAFVRSAGIWTPQQKLAASDGAASSGFGRSVALSGESALVGAPGATVGANAMQGAAYVFLRGVLSWTEQARLIASDGAASDSFGSAVALSGDTAIASASNDDVGTNVDQGSAYAFVRSGTSWSEQMQLVASDGASGDRLGVAVALAGNTALIGNAGIAPQNGAAHVFVRSGTTWASQPKLVASDGSPGDAFGAAVALSGGAALVGAPGDDTTGVFGNFQEGAAYVFALGSGTALVAINSDGPDPSTEGQTVSVEVGVSGNAAPTVDGYVAVTSSSGETCIAAMPAVGGGTSTTWTCDIVFASAGVRTLRASYIGSTSYPTATSIGETHAVDPAGRTLGLSGESPLIAPDGAAGDLAGTSVASSDEFVVMGAPNADGDGAVYVFRRVTDAAPPLSAKSVAGLVAAKDLVPVATLANAGGALGDKWGASVAISPDGATIAIGAPGAGSGAGGAAVFTRPTGSWASDDTPNAALVAPGGGIGDKFGSAVAVGAGGMVAVGAPGAASHGMAGAGAAHVFNGMTPIATLAPDPTTTDVGTAFGESLAMSGTRLVIGAPNENIGGRPDGGAVRLYGVDATSVGAPTLLTPPGTDFNKWGASVAIDGSTVVGGAPGATGANGAGFVFQDTGAGMTLRGRLDGGSDASGAGMGTAVAVAGDYILLGAPRADVGGRADQGRAFVFLQPEGGWRDAAASGSLVAADGAAGDGYGSAVALSRRGAAVGVPNRDLGAETDQGKADSFILDRIFRGAFE